jgi:hypothetical protein
LVQICEEVVKVGIAILLAPSTALKDTFEQRQSINIGISDVRPLRAVLSIFWPALLGLAGIVQVVLKPVLL